MRASFWLRLSILVMVLGGLSLPSRAEEDVLEEVSPATVADEVKQVAPECNNPEVIAWLKQQINAEIAKQKNQSPLLARHKELLMRKIANLKPSDALVDKQGVVYYKRTEYLRRYRGLITESRLCEMKWHRNQTLIVALFGHLQPNDANVNWSAVVSGVPGLAEYSTVDFGFNFPQE